MSANIDLVKTSLAQFANGEMEAFLGNLTADCVWKEPAGGQISGTWVGPQAILEGLFMPLAATFDWKHTAVDAIVEANGKVYVMGTEEGRNLKTGKSATTSFTQILEIRDGKLASFEHIFDTHVFQLTEN